MDFVKTYSDDLSPCPFCGSRSVVNTMLSEKEDVLGVYISCDECRVSGPLVSCYERAIDHWNVRS